MLPNQSKSEIFHTPINITRHAFLIAMFRINTVIISTRLNKMKCDFIDVYFCCRGLCLYWELNESGINPFCYLNRSISRDGWEISVYLSNYVYVRVCGYACAERIGANGLCWQPRALGAWLNNYILENLWKLITSPWPDLRYIYI